MFKNSCDHPWYDNDLRVLRNLRNKIWRLFCKSGSSLDLMYYNDLCLRFNDLAMTRYHSYILKIECNLKNNPGAFWKYINDKRNARGYPSEMSYNDVLGVDDNSICNLFSEFFKLSYEDCDGASSNINTDNIISFDYLAKINLFVGIEDVRGAIMKCKNKYTYGPDGIPTVILRECVNVLALPLSILFNKSLSTCSFPNMWKTSYIIPLHKKGRKNDVSNYRPVARLSAIPKIFEALVTTAIAFNVKSIICPEQHGFVAGRSTTTNLLDFVTYCFDKFNCKSQVDCIFTDFSKAFDKLSHPIMLAKLLKIGFGFNFVSWVESYLVGRSCRVLLGDTLSQSFDVTSGVPQGSHLGPILFILYINDMQSVIKYSECKIYADDVKIYRSIDSPYDSHLLQKDLDAFYNWCLINHMFLNINKCKIINFTRKNSTMTYSYELCGNKLNNLDMLLDLGVYLDSKLTFKYHFDYIVSRANTVMGFIYRESRDLTDPYCIRALFFALVRSILEYACPVWSPYYACDVARLESIQKRFLRFALKDLPWSDPYVLPRYEHRLNLLGMPTLLKHREYIGLTFICNVLNFKVDCANILNKLNIRINNRNLRSVEYFYVGNYRTNYGRYNPLNVLLMLYNSSSEILLDNNTKTVAFRTRFYNGQ